jgi:hypothetical protein
MKHEPFSWGMVVVCGLACSLLSSCADPTSRRAEAHRLRQASAALVSRGLPALPVDVTDVRCWTHGLFAKYLNVKCTASPNQALDYLRRAGANYYLEFQREGQEYRILATHLLTAAPGATEKPDLSCLTDRTGFLAQSWFESVYDIRHGWYHHSSPPDTSLQYYLFYDLDSLQFYVYWTNISCQ